MKILARCQFCLLTVCVHSRGMASLGVTSDQYGSLLIPIIMSKLLSEIRLQIARNSKDSVWKMDEFSNVIKMARWRKQARTENHPKHRDMPNFVINPHFSVLWSHSKVRAAEENVSFVETCNILPLAMLLRITLNEETFWNEIIDVLIACDLVTMWRNAKIETHAVTAVSGIISRFVRCVTKKARNRRKFLPKKRRQQRQQCATKQRELFSYKRRRLQLLTMYFRNCVSQNSSGYRKSTYLHKKPMKIKAKSVTCQVGNITSQHLWIWKVHKTTMRCSKPTLTRISGRNRDISAVFSEDLFSGVC